MAVKNELTPRFIENYLDHLRELSEVGEIPEEPHGHPVNHFLLIGDWTESGRQ